MKIFRNPFGDRLRKRIQRLSDDELASWAANANVGVWKGLEDYKRLHDRAELDELSKEAAIIMLIIEEFQKRDDLINNRA